MRPVKSTSPIHVMDIAGLLLCLLIFYLLVPDSHPLFVPDEGRYAEVAREMLASRDFITPHLNGVPFLDKPVLYYWLQASAMYLFGLKEWVLRLWPALCGITACLATCTIGQTLFNQRTGLLATIILATSPLYYGSAHYANLDLEVAVWISLSLYMLLLGLHMETRSARNGFFIGAWFFTGLAFLTKGLIALAFPVMVTGSFIILSGQWHKLKGIHLLLGPLLFAAIILPWCWLAQKANPEFLHYFFITQQITRFLSMAAFNNQEPFWFYVPILFAGCLPWALFFIPAFYYQIKLLRAHYAENTPGLFITLWAVLIFCFYSIPHSKTLGYILPVIPPLALLTAQYLDARWQARIFRIKTPVCFFILSVCALIFLLALILHAGKLNQKTIKPLALTLKQVIPPQTEVVGYYRYYQDLPLYLQKRITIVADWQASDIPQHDGWVRELWYGMRFQDTHQWLIGENTFWQRWYTAKPLVVLMDIDTLPQFTAKAGTSIKSSGKYQTTAWVSNVPLL